MDAWTVALSLFSGVVGSAFGWHATRSASRYAEKAQMRRDSLADDAEVMSFLQSISDELSALVEVHMSSGGRVLEAASGSEALVMIYPVSDHYFTIFEANAGRLGKLRSVDLRKRVVLTYVHFKALVDSIRLNNVISAGVESAQFAERRDPHNSIARMESQVQLERAKEYAGALVEAHRRAMRSYNQLMSALTAVERK
ncbi:hypothetical protein [Stenotrophomonas sp. GZD-301]|uniref:hypothetical protein n=1 Tax=Stenotrophomonas sp. GZD-301 TaxID=3404814 RepID=UPI003BB6F193